MLIETSKNNISAVKEQININITGCQSISCQAVVGWEIKHKFILIQIQHSKNTSIYTEKYLNKVVFE